MSLKKAEGRRQRAEGFVPYGKQATDEDSKPAMTRAIKLEIW
jgi:hypothetical protein